MSKCFFCNAKAEKKCGKCNFVNYCSRDCQVVDWRKTHKFFCESLPFPKRDSYEKSVYGFLLNPTGDLKIVKVALDKGGETPVLAPFLDPLGTLKSEMNNLISPFKNYMLPRKLYEEKNLDNTLQFNYRDNFLYDGSSPNKCIQKIAGNRNGHDWRGPMLVLKIKDVDPINFGLGPHTYIDMEMNDLQDMRDFFLWYGSADSEKTAEKNRAEFLRNFPGFKVCEL